MMGSVTRSQQGWRARLELGFSKRAARTVLHHRRRLGPLSVQRALYPEGDVCHIYLLHPPGGVVGGDRIEVDLELAAESRVLLTTPGATKFYRSAGAVATQEQQLRVADGAVLEWLPQENIYFPGASVKSRLVLNLEGSAKVALWEVHCLGRPVIGEQFDTGDVDTHWAIYRDGTPLLMERLRVVEESMHAPALLNRQPVTGTLLISGVVQDQMEQVRSFSISSERESLASTLIEDLLVVRYLGDSTERARNRFALIWSTVRQQTLGRGAVVPRVWNT